LIQSSVPWEGSARVWSKSKRMAFRGFFMGAFLALKHNNKLMKGTKFGQIRLHYKALG
jgi:hypothetical protein